MPFADTAGGRLRFREVGSNRDGTPVVFVHGAGGGSAAWMRVLSRLSDRRALALDLPGHGRSSGSFTTIEGARDAVGQLCAGLGIERAVLVGHSMGGAIALAAALAWPDRVAGLGLCATAARFRVPASTLDRVGSATADAWLSELAFSPETPRDDVRRAVALAFAAEPEVRRRDFALLDGLDYRPRLGEVRAPTAVIGGADDLMLPAKLSVELAAGIPGAVHTEIGRAGHFVMLERPDDFHSALAALLERSN